MVRSTMSRLVPRRRWMAVAFVALAAIAVVVFVPTFDAYVATHGIEDADVRVTDAAMAADGETLLLSVRFQNPTNTRVSVVSGGITARDGGTLVTGVAGTRLERATVPPGETVTLNATVTVLEDHRDQAAAAVGEDRLWYRGHVWVRIGDEQLKVRISPHRVRTDAD